MYTAIISAAALAVVAADDGISTQFVTKTLSTITVQNFHTPNAVLIGELATNASVTNSSTSAGSNGTSNSTSSTKTPTASHNAAIAQSVPIAAAVAAVAAYLL